MRTASCCVPILLGLQLADGNGVMRIWTDTNSTATQGNPDARPGNAPIARPAQRVMKLMCVIATDLTQCATMRTACRSTRRTRSRSTRAATPPTVHSIAGAASERNLSKAARQALSTPKRYAMEKELALLRSSRIRGAQAERTGIRLSMMATSCRFSSHATLLFIYAGCASHQSVLLKLNRIRGPLLDASH